MTTPLPAGTAAGAGSTPRDQSVVQAMAGVIRRPRSTFESVVSHPRWGTLLLVTTIMSAVAGAVFMATAVGQQALVDQWERTAAAFGQPVDDAGYARLENLGERSSVVYAVTAALVAGPVLAVGVAILLRVVFRGRASFQEAMAVTTYAGGILAIRQVLAAPLGYVRETTSSATSLGALFSSFEGTSPVARFFSALDVFVIWWAIVLAIGVSVLYHRRARTIVGAFLGAYATLALLLATAMAVTGGSV